MEIEQIVEKKIRLTSDQLMVVVKDYFGKMGIEIDSMTFNICRKPADTYGDYSDTYALTEVVLVTTVTETREI